MDKGGQPVAGTSTDAIMLDAAEQEEQAIKTKVSNDSLQVSLP